jgi:hypothetical protein
LTIIHQSITVQYELLYHSFCEIQLVGEIMAKKAPRGDRSDPKQNKSLAIRTLLEKMPQSKATEIAQAVKKEYGHDVGVNLIYMLKTKANMKANQRRKARAGNGGKAAGRPTSAPMNSAATWVEAIKIGRQLLRATGSVENATALLRALDAK